MDDIDGAALPEAGIALIGMAGQFPGAPDVETFWQNLCAGVESIRVFSDDELIEAGVDPTLLAKPNYVKAGAVLDDITGFDAPFFAMTPRDAQIMDPQQRFFLETVWGALEDAGINPDTYPGPIGLYAGATLSSYMLNNLVPNRPLVDTIGLYPITLANDKDFLTTRASYKLNLRGPSLAVQTACSTALVAVHLACQSLLSGECDIALAGGVSLRVPHIEGYLYQEGDIASPDGHCRAFDAHAQGTVTGNGVGVVVLKRLAEAVAAGDRIIAVIRGTAINNDGAGKVGFTAPSADSQAAVISEAQAVAGVPPATITYVEAHGTGTILGDPIEVRGLTKAFRAGTDATNYCALGSVKTNIGHLDAAAGVAGLIKTALALHHRQLPPSLHYTRPNPEIDFAASPFFVNTQLTDWPAGPTPRRAGVSAFGIGGTNAHAVLEEAPPATPGSAGRPWQLVTLAAATPAALDAAATRLAAYLTAHPDLPLADVAYTLQTGRRPFPHRRVAVSADTAEAAAALASGDPQHIASGTATASPPAIAFLFPGQGAQHLHMARELYAEEPVFREQFDYCADQLLPLLGHDLRSILYPPDEAAEQAQEMLYETWMTQPALFVIEYALARLWMEWGVRPQAMLGHSIGEYVAACLAGVLTLDDALALVVTRGRLMQEVPHGSMLAVFLPEAETRALLEPDLTIAALNGPRLTVASGPTPAIDRLQAALTEAGTDSLRLHTSHAFHSSMADPIIAPFAAAVAAVPLHPPQIPYISNVTGTWITAEEATDPNYWARHLRHTVRFTQGLATLLDEPRRLLLEVGPGHTLTGLGRQHPARQTGQTAIPSLPRPQEQASDARSVQSALGQLWLAGVAVDWAAYYTAEERRRVALPTYPFQHQSYWIDAPRAATVAAAQPEAASALAQALALGGLTDAALSPSPHAPAPPAAAAPSPNGHTAPDGVEAALPAPAGEETLSTRLAAIMAGLLGTTPGPEDNFFVLGGESLLAIQLVSRVRDAYQINLPLQRFFAEPTLRGLTVLVEEGLAEQAANTDLERLLAEIENLPPEEIAAALAGDAAPATNGADPPAPTIAALAEQPAVIMMATTPPPEEPLLQTTHDGDPPATASTRPLDFSIFFFSGDESAFPGNKYQLVIEGARWADQNGFAAVWTPERHLHRFGGLYPNPATLNAALAMVTSRIHLRAGSVVTPLHHPLRIAEQWSVVDNLSGGRVGIAFAAGFHPNDFLFAPDDYAERREIAVRNMEIVERLWWGETVKMRGGLGNMIDVTLYPRPVQPELPIWITTSEHPDTFRRAGELGKNVLTALLALTPEQLAERIALYREGRQAGGWHLDSGQVTVMVHTYVGSSPDDAVVKEEVREAFYTYLRSHFELVRSQAKSEGRDIENLSEEDTAAVFANAFDRYYHGHSLMGPPSAIRAMLARLQAAGATEIACLVDFGLSMEAVFTSLNNLNQLRSAQAAPALVAVGAGNGYAR